MFCNKCGKEIVEGSDTCTECGSLIGRDAHGVAGVAGAVNSSEQVVVPATTLKRLLNVIIDGVFLILFNFVVNIVAPFIPFESVLVIIFFLIIFLNLGGYYIICESIWGVTVGKLITKTKVVDVNGKKPDFWRVLGRTLSRWIPFEFISFFFGNYPVGLHDHLSGTFVVSKDMTEADAKKLDKEKIKNVTGNNSSKSLTIIIVFVVALFVISVIGILSSVVLASLSSARDKGMDSAIKSSINNLAISGEIYYLENNDTYLGFCEQSDIVEGLELAADSDLEDDEPGKYECNDSEDRFAITAPLSTDSHWCADSEGSKTEIYEKIGDELSCNSVSSE